MKKILLILATLVIALNAFAQKRFEGHAIWAHPGDLGKSEKEVKEFFELLKKCHIDIVVPLIKDTAGNIFWHSQKFPSAVHPDYKEFDLLRAATKYARQYEIKLHAWLCDFPEGKNSAALKLHPEWAMLNPQGGYTSEEKVTEDQPYNEIWMCPARRPGYTDQWLLPMIEEIVQNYDVDGIHHDYVRYPGDVAPDSYCFCDYCLEYYLTYNHHYYLNQPQKQIQLKHVRLREGANWDLDFTLKPPNWPQMSREEKADFLLNGKSIDKNDMDYFFYETRCDAITRFVREAREMASKIKPQVEFSAAVFTNPMTSGRFIGQRWTDFAQWADIIMPMNYRSHFQGSFEDFLTCLEDYIQAQKIWCKGKSLLYIGITGHYIYQEERQPWQRALEILKPGANPEAFREELKQLMNENIAYLRKFSSSRAAELDSKFSSFLNGKIQGEALTKEIQKILADPPPGFFPEEKFLRTIETIRKARPDGIVIFSAGIISRNKLWPSLEKAFSNPAE